MKLNKWTMALAAVGVVSLGSIAQAEEQHQVLTALSSTTLSGYVDTSANWRIGNNRGPLPGRTFDGADKQDGFNMNRVQLSLDKPLDEGQWSAGYHVDLVFGPDANYYGTIANGGAVVPVGGANSFNVKQAYATFRAPVGNGIDFKMGVFDTIIGYEVFETGNNPNYSRSYGYFIEPTHHTGLLASYKVNDMFSFSGGIADAYTGPINDKFAGASSIKTYMGSLTITVPEKSGPLAGSAFYLGGVHGRNSATLPTNPATTTSYYAGGTINTPLTGLTLGAAFDYRQNGVLATLPTVQNNWAWAGAVYAGYQATEKLKLNARGEWAKGSPGTFYTRGGFGETQNDLVALTLMADYSLWAAMITRAELRWDHALNGDSAFATGSGPQPFASAPPADHNALTVALNVIYKF